MKNPIKQIEKLLDIQLEAHDYKKEYQVNTYSIATKDNMLRELVLNAIHITNINILLPFSKYLHGLTLINCTIDRISEIFNFKELGNLTLDNVSINDLDECYKNKNSNTIYNGNLSMVNLLNMEIEHLGLLQPMAKKLDHVFITDCTLHNFYEVNLFPKLYDLRLDGVIIKKSDTDIIWQNLKKNFTWLRLYQMKIEDIAYFIPITKGLQGLSLNSCEVGSLKTIYQFTQLKEFEVDALTVIKDQEVPKENNTPYQIKECIVGREKNNPKVKVDLKNLVSIIHYIKHLNFHQYVNGTNASLKYFIQLENLEFTHSSVDLKNFLSVAPQIKRMSFEQSEFIDTKVLRNFIQLEAIEIYTDPHQNGLKDLKKILTLKHQLKKLKIDEDEVKNLECIREFTKLEYLNITAASITVTESVLSLSSLSKLSLYIEEDVGGKEITVLDLKKLTNIKVLEIDGSNLFKFIGLNHLIQLQSLSLPCNSVIENDFSNQNRLSYYKK